MHPSSETVLPYYVYILSNNAGSVLYTGTTHDLIQRVWQHKEKLVPGFTSRYNVHRLVYFEQGEDMTGVLEREKQIKGGSRAKKIALVNEINPRWLDLYDELVREDGASEVLASIAARREAGQK